MEKLLKGRGILRREDSVGKGDAVSSGIFSSIPSVPISTECRCQSLFSLYSFSSCLQSVYFHNTVVSPCYRLHTSCLHHAGVTSCFVLNMWF